MIVVQFVLCHRDSAATMIFLRNISSTQYVQIQRMNMYCTVLYYHSNRCSNSVVINIIESYRYEIHILQHTVIYSRTTAAVLYWFQVGTTAVLVGIPTTVYAIAVIHMYLHMYTV